MLLVSGQRLTDHSLSRLICRVGGMDFEALPLASTKAPESPPTYFEIYMWIVNFPLVHTYISKYNDTTGVNLN